MSGFARGAIQRYAEAQARGRTSAENAAVQGLGLRKRLKSSDFMGLTHYFSLIRPGNCVIAALATLIGSLVSLNSGVIFDIYIPGYSSIAFAMGAAFLICGGGQAINDYFDAETDKRIRPEKVIPSGKVSKRRALLAALGLFLAGNLLAFFVNGAAVVIAAVFTLLLVAYSAVLRPYKYLGNWVVGAGMAFTLIFGASVYGVYDAVVWLALAALFAGVAREVIKDLEDLEADVEKVSLPMVIGEKASVGVVIVLYVLSIGSAVYAYASGIFGNYFYLLFVAIAGGLFANSSFLTWKQKEHRAQQFSKLGMLIALVAFLVGVFG